MNREKTVLIITDSPDRFVAAAALLIDDGYRVHFKTGVGAGLSFATAALPEVIVSELAAPNVDGILLCLHIQDDPVLRSIPILLVGDLSVRSPIVRDGIHCGAAKYLQRPIAPLDLAEACRDLPARETPIDSPQAGYLLEMENRLAGAIPRTEIADQPALSTT